MWSKTHTKYKKKCWVAVVKLGPRICAFFRCRVRGRFEMKVLNATNSPTNAPNSVERQAKRKIAILGAPPILTHAHCHQTFVHSRSRPLSPRPPPLPPFPSRRSAADSVFESSQTKSGRASSTEKHSLSDQSQMEIPVNAAYERMQGCWQACTIPDILLAELQVSSQIALVFH